MHSCYVDCQGKAIHLLANSRYLAYGVYLRRPHCSGSLAKKRYSIFQGKWSELYLLLSAQAQGCPARRKDEQVRAVRQQIGRKRCAVQHLFDVIEHKYELLPSHQYPYLPAKPAVDRLVT